MKLSNLNQIFENEQALSSRTLENKWIALTQKTQAVVAWAKSYKALARKLKKDQREQVVLLKIPKSDQINR